MSMVKKNLVFNYRRSLLVFFMQKFFPSNVVMKYAVNYSLKNCNFFFKFRR